MYKALVVSRSKELFVFLPNIIVSRSLKSCQIGVSINLSKLSPNSLYYCPPEYVGLGSEFNEILQWIKMKFQNEASTDQNDYFSL